MSLDGITADLAIRHGEGRWFGLAAEKLFDTTLMPAYSPALIQHTGKEVSKYPLIHFRPQGTFISPTDWAGYQKSARMPELNIDTELAFSDENHAISAAVGGQGVLLMNRQLIEDGLADWCILLGPNWKTAPFFWSIRNIDVRTRRFWPFETG